MAASFALTAWLSDEQVLGGWAWYVMAQGNVLLILAFEALIPRDPAHSPFRDRQSWNDIGHMLLFKLAIRPAMWGVAFAIVQFFAPEESDVGGFWPSSLPVAAQFLILLLVFDLIGYLFHRTLHRFDRLYVFHALHHDTRRLHVLKSNRLHVGEEIANFMLLVPAMILAGIPGHLVIWLGMWEVFEGNLAHSNVDQRFPRWFHYVVRTSGVHRIHHSCDDGQQNSNFGGLPIWDVIFGTYRHPFDTHVAETGVAGDPIPPGFVGQLWFPFRAMFRPAMATAASGPADSCAESGGDDRAPILQSDPDLRSGISFR